MNLTAQLAVVFTGPQDEGEGVTPTRRADAAIAFCKEYRGTPLVIAGDANWGKDVGLLTQRCRDHDFYNVKGLAFDGEASTLTDALLVVSHIANDPMMQSVIQVYLFVDDWTMERAKLFLQTECDKRFGRRIRVIPMPITIGPRPPQRELDNELQGIADYKAGIYGQRIIEDPYGKPEQAARLAGK